MTEEQLIDAADAYAKKIASSYITGKKIAYDITFRDFMAGARCRDEEVKDLELAYRNLLHSFNERGCELAKQSSKLCELRNPWIKPSKQLPADGDDIVYLLYGCKAGRMKYHSTYEKWLRESASYWMKVILQEDKQ